ncbi:MAG: methyltransferase domain-containing protein, partial [Planctomycetes bacterium]|nr:methyltransferase domain-containing protein [Planctomycetota bacterium]
DGSFEFDVPPEMKTYLSSGGHTNFSRPPKQYPFVLSPATEHVLSADVEAGEGKVQLWVIEYEGEHRLSHQVVTLKPGPLEIRWRTQSGCDSWCVALRFSGRGRLRLSGLTISARAAPSRQWVEEANWAEANIESGCEGKLRDDSIVLDPRGYRRPDDSLLPDLPTEAVVRRLEQQGVGRALFTSNGRGRLMNTYDQVCELARRSAARIYPLYRPRPGNIARSPDEDFEFRQMELLWQEGLLYGLKIHLGTDEPPSQRVLDWVERRQLLTLWHVSRPEQLDWLEANVLGRYGFPVLLSHFGGYPLDRLRYKTAIEMLSRHRQLYLVTSCVWFEPYLRRAIERCPHQVLFGSDSPAVDPAAARATIARLDVPDEHKALVLGENLRFLTERVQWYRWNALQKADDLLFPRLPGSPEELAAQGFKIVPPGELPAAEPESAKTFWGTRGHVEWYERDQPWRALGADLVADLKPRSVLEFGCNVGQNLLAVHQTCPDVRLVGADINPEAVQIGREKTGLDLRVGDETALDSFADGEFDLVFTVSVLDHVANVEEVCRRLLRVAGRYLYLLEVRLPVEGKVVEHFDHHHNAVRPSTGASYSWHLDKYLRDEPRVWRLDQRPVYLHDLSLGPYYTEYLAFLDTPGRR